MEVDGERWSHEEMARLGVAFEEEHRADPRIDPTNGVKSKTWWPFISLAHFSVPLLHCLIGIRDGIMTKFQNIVSDKIEYISLKEIWLKLSVAIMNEKY